MQRAPESSDVAELGIGERGGDLQARGSRASNQGERLTSFLLEGRTSGNLRDHTPITTTRRRARAASRGGGATSGRRPKPHA
jgi:hypothetical protein